MNEKQKVKRKMSSKNLTDNSLGIRITQLVFEFAKNNSFEEKSQPLNILLSIIIKQITTDKKMGLWAMKQYGELLKKCKIVHPSPQDLYAKAAYAWMMLEDYHNAIEMIKIGGVKGDDKWQDINMLLWIVERTLKRNKLDLAKDACDFIPARETEKIAALTMIAEYLSKKGKKNEADDYFEGAINVQLSGGYAPWVASRELCILAIIANQCGHDLIAKKAFNKAVNRGLLAVNRLDKILNILEISYYLNHVKMLEEANNELDRGTKLIGDLMPGNTAEKALLLRAYAQLYLLMGEKKKAAELLNAAETTLSLSKVKKYNRIDAKKLIDDTKIFLGSKKLKLSDINLFGVFSAGRMELQYSFYIAKHPVQVIDKTTYAVYINREKTLKDCTVFDKIEKASDPELDELLVKVLKTSRRSWLASKRIISLCIFIEAAVEKNRLSLASEAVELLSAELLKKRDYKIVKIGGMEITVKGAVSRLFLTALTLINLKTAEDIHLKEERTKIKTNLFSRTFQKLKEKKIKSMNDKIGEDIDRAWDAIRPFLVNSDYTKQTLIDYVKESESEAESVRAVLHRILEENYLIFSVDRKWELEELLSDIQTVCPKFEYILETDKTYDVRTGERYFKGTIFGKKYTFRSKEFLPMELIEEKLRPLLETNIHYTIIRLDPNGEMLDYMVVPLNQKEQAEKIRLI